MPAPRCDICRGMIGSTVIEVTYLKCQKCGLTFCCEKCASQHMCGITTSAPSFEREGIYDRMGMIFGAITFFVLVCATVYIWCLLYSLIPLSLTILLFYLEKRDKKLIPKRITEMESKSPSCPICGRRTHYGGVKVQRYYCEACDKYL
jgi:hypothetical protein